MKKIVYFLIIVIINFSCKKEVSKEENKSIIVLDAINELEKPKLSFNKNFILGKFNYKKDTSFVKVKTKHSSKTLYLNKEVYTAFQNMFTHALKDGINLKIISGTRNFTEQKYIWERKWKKYKKLAPIDRARKILEFSSMPSTSRHHWGTDMDINNLNNSYFDKGKGKKEYEWLTKNANAFGFYQVYTSKDNGRTGYNLEKWHWSYLPLSSDYLKFYTENITYKDINGFKGAELADKINAIENYVNGIALKAKY